MNTLSNTANVDSKYYDFNDPVTATSEIVKHQAVAKDSDQDRVRNYAIGVYYNIGVFDIAVCQAADIGSSVNVPDTVSDDCTDQGVRIK